MQLEGTRSAEEVRAALERVLARPEFASRRSMLDEWIEGAFERLDLDLSSGARDAFVVVGSILLVALLGWILLRVARAVRGEREGEAGGSSDEGTPDTHRRVAELRGAARAARARGELRLALRLSFLALVIGLSKQGAVAYRDAWTWRECLSRGKPRPDARALLEGLVGELEAKDFGTFPVLASDIARLEELLDIHVGRLSGGTA